MLRMIFSPWMGLYVLTVVVLNLGFSYVPLIETAVGMASPMALLAGAVFVVRDFAQRSSGHYILLGMTVAAALSFWLADPFVALASVTAFALAELMDWGLYTVTKKPFHKRVLWSSVLSTPIDTAVFLGMISGLTTGTFILMVGAKMVAALLIYFWYRESPRTDDHAYK